MDLTTLTWAPRARVFRRAYIKRRSATTGLFEASWFEITKDVKTWGTIQRHVDHIRPSLFRLNGITMKMANDEGLYNPEDDEASHWFGYANQQRTLLKIEAGFLDITLASAIYTRTEYPSDPTAYIGIVSGDVIVSSQNTVDLRIKPLLQVFEDFPARNLVGWTSTGLTASQFITMLRDQTDGSSNYIFRPFFDNTTTTWEFTSTGTIYSNLNTSTAKDVIDLNVWDVIQKLAEAENHVPYITRTGTFRFVPKSANTSTAQWEFFGINSHDRTYGHTIKKINSFGKKLENFYSRVEVKFVDTDTATSYAVAETTLTVSGTNNTWNLGYRTFAFENFWIPNTATASTIVTAIHDEYKTLKNELDFVSTFIPTVDVLDRVEVSYDATALNPRSRWDMNNWADDPAGDDLYWDDSRGDAIRLTNEPFKVLSVEQSIDKMETKIIAREI